MKKFIETGSPFHRVHLWQVFVGFTLVLAALHSYAWLFVATGDVSDSPELVRLFDMDSEKNMPTAFVVLLLVMLSIFLFRAARQKKIMRRAMNEVALLVLLGCAALAVGIDEWFELHELLIEPVRSLFPGGVFFKHAWVIPALSLVLAVVFLSRRMWRRFPKETIQWGVIGLTVYLFGAGVMELVGGMYLAQYDSIVVYKFITLAEELLEIFGIIIVINTIARYRIHIYPDTADSPMTQQ